MTPAIGSGAAATQGMGAALSQPPGGGPPGQAGQSMPDPSAAAPGMGQDAQSSQINSTLSQIRNIGTATQALMGLVPTASDEIQQIQELLKAVVVKAAAAGPMSNGSGMAVPGNGGGA